MKKRSLALAPYWAAMAKEKWTAAHDALRGAIKDERLGEFPPWMGQVLAFRRKEA